MGKAKKEEKGLRGRNWHAVNAFIGRNSAGPMKHRAMPRGGISNDFRDYLDDYLDELESSVEENGEYCSFCGNSGWVDDGVPCENCHEKEETK